MLALCPKCRRHVRQSESKCPFCGSARSPTASPQGLGLAVALTVAAAIGCVGETEDNGGAGGNSANVGGMAASGGSSAKSDSSGKGGSFQTAPVYAAPPMGGRSYVLPAYGVPPPPVGGAGQIHTAPVYAAPPMGGQTGQSDPAQGGQTNPEGGATSSGGSTASAGSSSSGGSTGVGGSRTILPAYGVSPVGGGHHGVS